jgi:coenzyme Q-binding protein COQ10
MPTFDTIRRVPFTPEQMFALVADVERYPEFVPLCEGLRVTSRSRVGDTEVLIADMDVGYKAIRETFTSRVTVEPDKLSVRAEAVAGPFRYLENRWSFIPVLGGCNVQFFISYEIRSLMLQMLAGAVFERAFSRFAEAFETRAHHVYGAPLVDKVSPA